MRLWNGGSRSSKAGVEGEMPVGVGTIVKMLKRIVGLSNALIPKVDGKLQGIEAVNSSQRTTNA